LKSVGQNTFASVKIFKFWYKHHMYRHALNLTIQLFLQHVLAEGKRL
jgi:hypothetical protein